MPRVTSMLRKSRKAFQDLDLLKVLRSEIVDEHCNPFRDIQSGSLGDFILEWDSPQSQDVVLRKKCESGEEVSVSALLGSEINEGESSLPREALMKVCIKKPGLSSILQFDCGLSGKGDDGLGFDIHNAHYLPSTNSLKSSVYKSPSYSSLDPHLQDELKNYLVSKGIDESFTSFLLLHLHRKEHGQYVNWLDKLEKMVAQSDDD